MKPLNYLAVVGLAYSVVISTGCGGNDCGTGTTETDGECLGTLQCGEGTQVANGACIPSNPDGLTCGGNTQLSEDGTECVLSEGACAAPATLDTATGQCVAPGDLECGTGTVERDGFCIPSCDGVDGIFLTPNATRTGCVTAARVQIVHASPDSELASVDIYSGPNLVETQDGESVGDDVTYGQATPLVKIAIDAALRVTAGNADSNEDFLLELPSGSLERGRYLIVIQGGVASRARGIAIYSDLREESSQNTRIQFAAVNATSDAPAFSGGLQESYGVAASAELFTNVAYSTGGGSLSYEGADARTEAFDVYPNGGGVPYASFQTSLGDSFEADSGFTPNLSVVLVAIGSLNPGNGEPGFELLAVSSDGQSGFLDRAARLQVVHAAIDAPTEVDVYLGEMGATSAAAGTEVVEDLVYQNATPFRSYVAGVPGMLQVTEANQATLAVNEPFTPMIGQVARLVAVGGADGQELTVSVVNGSEFAADPATIDLQVFHASTNAPTPVEVYFTADTEGAPMLNRPADIPELTFGDEVDVVRGRVFDENYDITLSTDGSTPLVDFDIDFDNTGTLAGEAPFLVVTGDATAELQLLVVDASGAAVPE